MNRSFFLALPLLASTQFALAQQSANSDVSVPTQRPALQKAAANLDQTETAAALVPSSNYILGPGDQISLAVTDLPDEYTDETYRIDMQGNVSLPLAGRVHAGGLTTEGLEGEIRDHLKRILKDPEVVVNIAEFNSQPVSVLGAVSAPGVRQLQGQKNLFEVLSLAGGLRSDAGTTMKITRDLKWGRIPLPEASNDVTGRYSVASVKIKSIMNATDPSENIVVMPGDTISIPRAQLVYVVGSVTTPGGFQIGENDTISTLQAVALAEGLQKTAAIDKAKILRMVPGSNNRAEIPINIKLLMAGKTNDPLLRPDDILFVPNSTKKTAGYRTLDAVTLAATYGAVRSY
jgi:polysaccharide export outer membrane protein